MAKIPAKTQSKQCMVLFVHGIRDAGFWEQELRSLFEAEGFIAKPIGFHVFDIFRFLFGFRRNAIERVKRQIEAAIEDYPNTEVTIIAHSFGTFAVTRILDDDPNLRVDRLVMCGAIVPRRFRWDKVTRLNARNGHLTVVNEFSARDIWPLFARHATFGFGDVGTIGCQDTDVTDRRHTIRHSEYVTANFATTYWLPWLAKGEPLVYPKAPPGNPWYFVINRSPVTMVAGVLGLVVLFGAYLANDRYNFRTQGTIDYKPTAGVNFQVIGHRRMDGNAQETLFSAQYPNLPTRHALFSDERFQKIDVVIKNRIPIQCNTEALENAAPAGRSEVNQTVYEFDLSRAYRMFGRAQMEFFYEDHAIDGGRTFDRLTFSAGGSIDPAAVRVIKVTHGGDECLDASYQTANFSPFVVVKPSADAPKGIITSLISNAFAQIASKKPDAQEIQDLLGSGDDPLRDLAVETIIANPSDYAEQVNAMVVKGNGNDNNLATLILAARNARPLPIALDTKRVIELSYSGNAKVRDAARSYIRQLDVVTDDVAAAAQAMVDTRLQDLRGQPVPGSSFNEDYLLLVTARDIYYNLGFKQLNLYVTAVQNGQKPDLAPILGTFKKGRELRARAANADQKIALSKNAYGQAYALYVAAMNQEAVAAGKGESPVEFIARAAKEGRRVSDQTAAPVFNEFLGEVSSNAKLYPWPAHIVQAQRCTAAFQFGCLELDQMVN